MIDKNAKILLLERLNKGFIQCEIPDHCRRGLEMYLSEGILPGSFLTAVLSNDLMEACARADMSNEKRLKNYAMLMYSFMPSGSYGSSVKVMNWIARFHEPTESIQEIE